MTFADAFFQLLIWIPLMLLWGFALWDLFHTSMSGIAKALWAIAIVLVPVLGVVLYFMVRPVRSHQYVQSHPGQVGPDIDTMDTIARLHDLNQRGVLDDAEFAKYKTFMVR